MISSTFCGSRYKTQINIVADTMMEIRRGIRGYREIWPDLILDEIIIVEGKYVATVFQHYIDRGCPTCH